MPHGKSGPSPDLQKITIPAANPFEILHHCLELLGQAHSYPHSFLNLQPLHLAACWRSILEGNTVLAKATSPPNLPTPPPVYHSLSFSLHPPPVECYHSSLQPPAAPAADASARKSFFQLQSYQHQNIRKPQLDKNIQGIALQPGAARSIHLLHFSLLSFATMHSVLVREHMSQGFNARRPRSLIVIASSSRFSFADFRTAFDGLTSMKVWFFESKFLTSSLLPSTPIYACLFVHFARYAHFPTYSPYPIIALRSKLVGRELML